MTEMLRPVDEEALADLERQIRSMGKGTRYYVPRT